MPGAIQPPKVSFWERPSIPLAVPLALALAVWVVGAIMAMQSPPRPPPRPHIRAGNATELAPAIRAAPRAMVYAGCIWSTYSVKARQRFFETAQQVVREHPKAEIQFFIIENES